MKHSYFAFPLFWLSVMAAVQVPNCATGCIVAAVQNATTCGINDLPCQCTSSNYALIQAAATTCVLSDCGSNAIQVLSAVNAECQAALSSSYASGAIITAASAVPSAAGTVGGAAAATSTATGSPTTVTGTIVECGCGGLSTAYPSTALSAIPSPTASKNGNVTTARPSIAYNMAAGAPKSLDVTENVLAIGLLVFLALEL